jgi:hypothetical protein
MTASNQDAIQPILAADKSTGVKASASPGDILAEGRPVDRYHAGAGTNRTTKLYIFLTPSIPIRLFSTITPMFSIGTSSLVFCSSFSPT